MVTRSWKTASLYVRYSPDWEVLKEWNNIVCVVYEKPIPLRLKAPLGRTIVHPTTLYDAEAWAIKRWQIHQLEVSKMRCLHTIRGVTQRERI